VRKAARTWILDAIKKNEHLSGAGDTIVIIALWLAWTSPEPQRALMREALRHDNRLVLAITERSIYGRRVINGRTMCMPPEVELAEIVQMLGMGPSTASVTTKLAPH
jgi:hypothetical protein